VTLHFAQSLDGRIATRTGAARWISGGPATRYAHQLRAEVDAVIVGSGTALADDPLLTVRHVPGTSPLRIVLDGRGRLPETARVLADGCAPTLHVHRPDAAPATPPRPHVERWALPAGPGGEGIDLPELLARLARRGVAQILVEGGSGVLTSFLRGRLCDRLVIAIAPIVMGAGVDAVGDLFTERLDQALGFTHESVTRLGDDVLLDLCPRGAAP
jgi:riboflavin-specific deaminase-like protein